MKTHHPVWVSLGLALVIGCGGDGGPLDPNEKLSDVTAAQAMQECLYFNSEFPAKTTMCGSDTITETNGSCDETDYMAAPAGCTATVGDAEDCLSAIYDDPCATTIPAACAAEFTAACQGSDEDGND
jgi:hypothetical protein